MQASARPRSAERAFHRVRAQTRPPMAANETSAGLLAKFSPYYLAELSSQDCPPFCPPINCHRRPNKEETGKVEVMTCCGAHGAHGVHESVKTHALSITTRGIGLSTCNLCYIAATTADINPPIYAMYRAFLGLAEAKLATCPYLIGEPKACNAYNFKVKLYMLERAQTVPIVPEPIKRIIDAIDVITLDETKYVPMVAGQVKDDEGQLIPRPENLLLSNLRDVVVACSKDSTPCKYRAAFKDNCPIPGAVWENCLLTNANEIIPEDYNLVDGLWDDMWPLSMFFTRMRQKYPRLAGGVLLSKGACVSRAALISSYMSDLHAKPRLPCESADAYCRRCHPQGFLGSYYELEEMSDAERVAGQVALLGELPNLQVLGAHAQPLLAIHGLRLGQFDPAGTHVYGDYITALMVCNEALLAPPGGEGAAPCADRPPAAPDCRNWVTRTGQPADCAGCL